MVKPSKKGPGRRRVITVSIYALAWMILSVLSPIWIALALLIGLLRRRSFVILRLLIFAWFYFAFELVALVLVAGIFLTRRRGEARDSRLYALQAWWAMVNLSVAQRLLGLDIQVDGTELAVPGPSIFLVRHASILDTLLPCAYVQRPYGFRVRYVLKQELLFDPCIDIVGNALPNYFVDRGGDTQAELDGIRLLAENLGTDGLLMFPEGTRFSLEKRERALQRLARDGSELLPRARALSHVLPPKPGGVLALLDALPGVDCVFFAHSGLESFAKIKNLLSGEIVGSTVRVQLWRVDARDIPKDDADRLHWLYSEWAEVDAFVGNVAETK
jgi:1-acyl-sn-glycerol-3-phosphate acyltransferase